MAELKKEKPIKRDLRVSWFAPQMATTTNLPWVRGPRDLSHHVLLSQATSRPGNEAAGNGTSAHMGCQRCKQRFSRLSHGVIPNWLTKEAATGSCHLLASSPDSHSGQAQPGWHQELGSPHRWQVPNCLRHCHCLPGCALAGGWSQNQILNPNTLRPKY